VVVLVLGQTVGTVTVVALVSALVLVLKQDQVLTSVLAVARSAVGWWQWSSVTLPAVAAIDDTQRCSSFQCLSLQLLNRLLFLASDNPGYCGAFKGDVLTRNSPHLANGIAVNDIEDQALAARFATLGADHDIPLAVKLNVRVGFKPVTERAPWW